MSTGAREPPNLVPDEEEDEAEQDLIMAEGMDILQDLRSPQPPLLGAASVVPPTEDGRTATEPPPEQDTLVIESTIDSNNGWSEQVDKVVRTLANKAYKSRELHELAREQAKRRNFAFNMTLFAVTAFVAVYSLIPMAQTNVWLILLGGILAQAAALLSLVNAFLNFGADAEKHKMAEASFRALLAKMQQQLLLPNTKERINGGLFLQAGLDGLSKVANRAPPLPKKLLAQYRDIEKWRSAQEDPELRNITVGVGMGEIPMLERTAPASSAPPRTTPVIQRVAANGRENYVIDMDPITDDQLQTIFGVDAL